MLKLAQMCTHNHAAKTKFGFAFMIVVLDICINSVVGVVIIFVIVVVVIETSKCK